MKRILSMMVAMLIITTMFVLPASAEGKKSGLFTYELKGNGTAVITGYNWEANGKEDIYIPRMLDGYTVTGIGDYAFGDTSSTYDKGDIAVILPDTITSIGEKAFFERECIATINIPASVQTIGAGAFAGTYCNVSLDSNNAIFATIDGSLYNKTLKELVYWTGDSLNIPEGILSIGAYACYEFSLFSGESVSFPSTLVKIGDYAFYSAKLEECCLPDSLTSIGDYAFEYATWHTKANVSNGSITINNGNCYVLNVPQSVNQIGVGAFRYCKPSSIAGRNYSAIILGNCKIKEIPSEAFAGVCVYVSDERSYEGTIETFGSSIVCWSDSLQVIGEKAFADATLSLGSLPTGITQIEANAFQNTKFKIPGTYDQSRRQYTVDTKGTFTLPEGLESLGENAFDGCNGLGIVVLPTTLTSIGDNVCDRTRITLQVESGTYPAIWASENGYPTTSAGGDDTSWLNG